MIAEMRYEIILPNLPVRQSDAVKKLPPPLSRRKTGG
jgi:hypothetical protein